MPHDLSGRCGDRAAGGYAPGFSAADFDPRAIAARLNDLRERREIAKRALARAQAQERRLSRLLDEADARGLDAVYVRAFEMRHRVWLRIDSAAGACDALADEIYETERAIEEIGRPDQEAETRERLSLLRCTRMAQMGGLR